MVVCGSPEDVESLKPEPLREDDRFGSPSPLLLLPPPLPRRRPPPPGWSTGVPRHPPMSQHEHHRHRGASRPHILDYLIFSLESVPTCTIIPPFLCTSRDPRRRQGRQSIERSLQSVSHTDIDTHISPVPLPLSASLAAPLNESASASSVSPNRVRLSPLLPLALAPARSLTRAGLSVARSSGGRRAARRTAGKPRQSR